MPSSWFRDRLSRILGRPRSADVLPPPGLDSRIAKRKRRSDDGPRLSKGQQVAVALDHLVSGDAPVYRHQSGGREHYSLRPTVGRDWESHVIHGLRQGRETPAISHPTLPGDLEGPRESQKTQRLRRESVAGLNRSPLLIEVVAALSVGPSPHVRPDLIGKTIAGGEPVRGATTTANVGLRSSPSGFAVGAHKAIAPPGRHGKKHKKRRKKRR